MEEDQFRSYGGEEEHVYEDGVQRLRTLLGGVRVAMLTTADETGALKSRPMVVQEIDDHGDAWLVADEGSAKVHEVRHDRHVNLAFIRPVRGRWLSVSGRAAVVRDREKLRAMWDPMLQSWFPNGADDPRLCLLKVRLDEAVTWDAPLGNLLQVKRLAGLLMRRPTRGGEQARDTIVIRSRQAGIGDTAGIFGSAGGNMGVAPRARGPGGGEAGLRPEEVRAGRVGGRGGEGGGRGAGQGGGGARGTQPEARTGTGRATVSRVGTGGGGGTTGGTPRRGEAGGRETTGREAGGRETTGREMGGRETTGRETTGREAGGPGTTGRGGGRGAGGGATAGGGTGGGGTGGTRAESRGGAKGESRGGTTGGRTGGKATTTGRSGKSPEDVPPVVTGGAVAAALEAEVTPPTQPPKPPTRRGR